MVPSSFIVTPVLPSIVIVPSVVVKLDAAPASNEIPPLESIEVVVLSISTLPSISTVPVTDKLPLALICELPVIAFATVK